jgi:hypothetical protein
MSDKEQRRTTGHPGVVKRGDHRLARACRGHDEVAVPVVDLALNG